MTVYDLNREQLEELKQRLIMERNDRRGYGTAMNELANADIIVSDEEVYREYAGYDFVDEDFFVSEEEDMEDSTLEDKLLALEAKVQFIEDHGYIPWVSPFPSSTEKDLVNWVARAKNALNMAANCAHLLRY